jgi:hypothetical protein
MRLLVSARVDDMIRYQSGAICLALFPERPLSSQAAPVTEPKHCRMRFRFHLLTFDFLN